MLNSIYLPAPRLRQTGKMLGISLALFIINSSFLIPNCQCQWVQVSSDVTGTSLINSGNNIFAGTGNGVYLSANNGTSWILIPSSPPAISLAVNGNNIFAGTYQYGVYLSTDNGTSWTQTSLNNQNVSALAISGNYIFAAGNSLYLSTNNGTNWSPLNVSYVSALAISGNSCGNTTTPSSISGTGGTLGSPTSTVTTPTPIVTSPTSTTGTGGTLTTICTFVGIQPNSNEIPSSYELKQNYPNPFNPTTKIKFSLPLPSEGGVQAVKLVIYDALGREIAILVNHQLQPGTYEVDWNASNEPSGVYFYQLSTESFSETKKMLLIK
jgi:hypothetical protein